MNLAVIKWLGIGMLLIALAFQGHQVKSLRADLQVAKDAQTDPVTGKKWRDLYAVANTNYGTCTKNLDGTNADLAALSAATRAKADQDAASIAAATQALQAARKSNAALDVLIDNLKAPLPAGEVCARVLALDATVLRGLK